MQPTPPQVKAPGTVPAAPRKRFFAATHGMPPWVPRLLLQVTGILVLLFAAYHVMRALRGLLILVLISFFLATALEPAVAYLARRGWRRGPATGVIFVVAVLLVGSLIGLMVPLVISQTVNLIDKMPSYIDQFAEFLGRFGVDVAPDRILDAVTSIDASIEGLAGDFGGTVLGVGSALGATIFQMLSVALCTFSLTADAPRIRRGVLGVLTPQRQRMMIEVQEIAIAKVGGYIYSRTLLAGVAAGVTWVALMIIGVPFAVPLAIWVGVLSQFVPVVGTYIGGVLPVLIALLESPGKALWVAGFIALYQQFENYIVAPRITSRTMSLHPAVAFGSAIAGATLLGAPGALMALPVAATVQAWVSTYIERHELVESELIADDELDEEEREAAKEDDDASSEHPSP